MKTIYIFPNGQVEVGTGEPGYRWVPAYSEKKINSVSQPLPLREWQAIAKRDGDKLIKCEYEGDALEKIMAVAFHIKEIDGCFVVANSDDVSEGRDNLLKYRELSHAELRLAHVLKHPEEFVFPRKS